MLKNLFSIMLIIFFGSCSSTTRYEIHKSKDENIVKKEEIGLVGEISDNSTELMMTILSLDKNIRKNMYKDGKTPFDGNKIKNEFASYIFKSGLPEDEKNRVMIVLGYIFSEKVLYQDEIVVMKEIIQNIKTFADAANEKYKKQINKIIQIAFLRIALDEKEDLSTK